MSDTPTGSSAHGGPAQADPPREPAPAEETLKDLNKLLDDVRVIGTRLYADFAALARAQWKLTCYVISGSAKILAMRIVAFFIIGSFGIAAWVFANIAIWRAVANCTTHSFVPPLTIAALHGVVAAIIFAWQNSLKLE
jgi:hypothetical protein